MLFPLQIQICLFDVWDKGPLNGFLYCPDCGSKLYFNHPSRLKTSGTYMCGYEVAFKTGVTVEVEV